MGELFEMSRSFEKSGTDPGLAVPSPLPPPPDERNNEDPGVAMAMTAHFVELRRRILVSVAALAVMTGIGFLAALPVIELLEAMAPAGMSFVQISPGEVLMASVRLAVYTGFALASPVILYNVLRFVMPGLLPREKAVVLWSVLGGALLFAAGVVFAYFLVVPPALGFLFGYGDSVASNQISIQHYVSFCSALLFITGGMFELPMVLFLLSFTGLVTSRMLIAEWRRAIIAIFILAAVVTPGQDPLSMGMVGMAMAVLYGLSIIPIKLCGR